MIERLVDCVAQFDYPRDRMEIQVLDDSTDETQEVAARLREPSPGSWPADHVYRIAIIVKASRPERLQEGLKIRERRIRRHLRCRFLAAFDFLKSTVPYFYDPKLAMVQTRWSYINRHYSALTEVEAILLDGHFVIEHSSRYRRGNFFNFNGTAGVWRRAAIEDAGGWQHDTLTEDTDLSYRAQLRGWHFSYLPQIECASELPVEMNAFKSQQARWAKGLMQTAQENSAAGLTFKRASPRQDRSRLPPHREYQLSADDFSLDYSAASHGGAFLSGLVSGDGHRFTAFHCFHLLNFQLLSLFSARIVPKELETLDSLHADGYGCRYRSFHSECGSCSGSSLRNSLRICAHAEISRLMANGRTHGREISIARRQAGCLLLRSYLAFISLPRSFYAVENENYATVPFLLLFVWGYLYTGLMSLAQVYLERLRFGVRRRAKYGRPRTGAPGF